MARSLLAAASLLAFRPSHAQETSPYENLGRLELSDVLVEPVFRLTEPKRASFDLGHSYLAATWRRDSALGATFKIGSRDLLGTPARYGPQQNPSDIGIVEAFAQYDSVYGRIRAGLVPIPFSSQGGDVESKLAFTRSLLFQYRQVNLRDYGLSYKLTNEGFSTEWAIHNGEGAKDLDNELWFTARWGYEASRVFRIGASGSAGRTSPQSTNPLGTSSSADAGLDVNRIARIRIANLFFDWDLAPVKIESQITAGDTRQDDDITKFRALNLDFIVAGTKSLSWIARYDTFDPRTDRTGDLVSEAVLGTAWRSQYDNSVVFLLASKRWQQDVTPDSHQLLVLWRITPSAVSYHASL